jgi:holin-like protein
MIILLQMAALCLYYACLQYIVMFFNIPLPASVIGMVLLALLLLFKIIPLTWVEGGAIRFLVIMPVMFVPDGVALMTRGGELFANGIGLLFIFLLSTALVMAVTTGISTFLLKKGASTSHAKSS